MTYYCKVKYCRFDATHTTQGHLCGKCNKYGHGECECNDQLSKMHLRQYCRDILPLELQCTFGNCKYKKYHKSSAHHCKDCNKRSHSKSTCPSNKIINYHISCPICRQINIISKTQTNIFGSSTECVICLTNNVQVYFPVCGHTCICTTCLTKLDTNYIIDPDIKNENKLIDEHYPIDEIKNKLKETPSYIIIYEGMGCISYIRRYNELSPLEGYFCHSDDVYSPELIEKGKKFIDGYEFIESIIKLLQ